MDLFRNSNHLLKIFVEYMGGEPRRSDVKPEKWREIEKNFGPDIYPDILFLFTQHKFTAEEARRHWYRCLEHQADLAGRLGRDVGFQVTLCDYFTNIEPLLGHVAFVDVRRLLHRERSALLDEVTGLYNRRFLDRILKRELDQARRYNQPFSLLMIRVVSFKDILRGHGRTGADQMLTAVSSLLQDKARTVDHVIRYGEDEFALLLPRCDKEQALAAAERHRGALTGLPVPDLGAPGGASLKISIGLASFPIDSENGAELIRLAIHALVRIEQFGPRPETEAG